MSRLVSRSYVTRLFEVGIHLKNVFTLKIISTEIFCRRSFTKSYKKCRNSDEAWFHMPGFIDSHNYGVWPGENVHEYPESTSHLEKRGVWRSVSRKRIVDQIFSTSTITGDMYQDITQ